MKSVQDMTYGSHAKLIFFFSLPLMLGNVFQQMDHLADSGGVLRLLPGLLYLDLPTLRR